MFSQAAPARQGAGVDPGTGLAACARQAETPNCDDRPPGMVPELIVIHGISLPPGEFGGPWIERLFCNSLPADAHPYFATVADLRVSAHALVRRDGEIVQYVPFHRRAWHAGASSWRGRERCNDYSIGLELEGADDVPYSDAQYAAASGLAVDLLAAYPALQVDAIVGHSDIAPGRKTDPGLSFDWPRFRALLQYRLGTAAGGLP